MSSTPDWTALRLLREALKTFAAERGLSVRLPNRSAEEPPRPYLDVSHINVETGELTLGELRRIEGIFQVTVVEAAGEGDKRALELASQLAGYFKKTTRLMDKESEMTVLVHKAPQLRDPLYEGSALRVPVSIYYHTTV